MIAAFDRWHNYSSQGIMNNFGTYKGEGEKLIVQRITIIEFR